MLIRQLMGAQALQALSNAKDFVLRAIDQVTFKTRDLVGAEHSPSTMRWVPEPDTTSGDDRSRSSSSPPSH